MKIHFFNLILLFAFVTVSARSVHAAEEQELIAVLQSSAGPVEKCATCQQLRIYGTAQSVPALAALLGQERVGHAARYALEGIPGPESAAALRKALTKTSGLIKAGIIDSLDWRRDAESVPLLVPLMSDADTVIVKATASALGRIGGEKAVAALKVAREDSNTEVRLAVHESLLVCAENHLLAGDKPAAAALYGDLFSADVPPAIRTAAWRGLVLSNDNQRTELVVEALTGNDEQLRLTALKLLREIKDVQLVKAYLQQWDSLPASAQVAVLDGHLQFGAEALATIRTASKSPHPEVRVAAWQALADLSDTSMIPALAQAAAKGESAECEAARDTLVRIHGPGVRDALLAYLKQAEITEKSELLLALGKRSDTAAAPMLLQYAKAPEENIRLAALESLRRLAVTDTLMPLLDLIVTSKYDSDQNSILKALYAICQASPNKDQIGGQVIAAMNRMPAPERRFVLPLLLELATDAALTEMLKSAQNSDAQLVRESIRLLAQWPDDKPIPDLLKIAQTSENNVHRILALRGYISLTAASEQLSPEQKLQNCKTAMSLATDDAEKKKILAVASGVRTADSLSFVVSYLTAPALKEEAALAVLTIAKEIYPQNRQPAAEALKRALEAQVSENLRKQVQAAVDEIESVSSYLTDWQVAGPYMQKDKNCTQLFDIPFGPELPEAKVQWKPMPVKKLDQHPAYLDLLEALNGGEQRVAYLRTQIDSPAETAARLEIFSDDGVKAWLNGQLIHANNTMRPIMPEPDVVPVKLKKGANDLMLKVTQNNLPWGAIVRLRLDIS
jgi:HEAT repeat protein